MRSGMPGHNDRLIGRSDTGGQGGGTILCPIFDTRPPGYRGDSGFLGGNFYSEKTDNWVGSVEIDPFEDPGLVKVLFLPALYHYSLETHYIDDIPDFPYDDVSQWKNSHYLQKNWGRLVTRLQVDPTNDLEVKRIIPSLLVQVLTPPSDPRPDPRSAFLSISTTMINQVVEGESRSLCVQPTGRTQRKVRTLRRKRDFMRRTSDTPQARMGGG